MNLGNEPRVQGEPQGKDLLVLIAAYNEERAIGGVVASLVERRYPVVVIDDGSGDQTSRCARDSGAIVIRHPVNLGQGAALQTGFEFARRRGYASVVTFDADGQHDPADIEAMRVVRDQTGAAFVLGSRFLGAAVGMSLARRLLLGAAVLFTRITTGMQLTDAHNGLRLITSEGLKRIELRQNRMAHASEILEQIGASGLPYAECPVTVHYTDYSKAKGQSGLNSINIVLDLVLQRLRK